MQVQFTPPKTLDLRTTKCPLNFVQTKLALEKLAVGEVLEVWILAAGESAINIPNSLAQEGQPIVQDVTEADGTRKLWVQRAH